MTNLANYDFAAEEADLQKRQKILEAMAASGMQDIPISQGGYGAQAPISPLQVMGKLLQTVVAAKGMQDLSQKRGEMTERQQESLKSGLESFFRTSEGVNAPSMAKAPNADGSLQMQSTPGDPKKAIIEAMASGHPVLREMGAGLLKKLQEPKQDSGLTAKDFLPYADPTTIFQNPQDPSKWGPKKDVRTLGEAFFDVTGGQPKHVGGMVYSDPLQMQGEIVQGNNMTGKLQQVLSAPKTTVNVDTKTVNQGESSFMKKIGEQQAELVNNARTAKQQAEQSLVTANQLERLDKDISSVYSGPTANLAVTLGGFAKTLGLPTDTKKLANSEEYQSTIARQIAKVLTSGSGIGRSMTDEDRKAFEKQFPQLVATQEGRQYIIASMREAATKDIEYAKRVEGVLREKYPEAANLFELAPSNQAFPGASAPPGREFQAQPAAAGGVMSLDDYLKKMTGGR